MDLHSLQSHRRLVFKWQDTQVQNEDSYWGNYGPLNHQHRSKALQFRKPQTNLKMKHSHSLSSLKLKIRNLAAFRSHVWHLRIYRTRFAADHVSGNGQCTKSAEEPMRFESCTEETHIEDVIMSTYTLWKGHFFFFFYHNNIGYFKIMYLNANWM